MGTCEISAVERNRGAKWDFTFKSSFCSSNKILFHFWSATNLLVTSSASNSINKSFLCSSDQLNWRIFFVCFICCLSFNIGSCYDINFFLLFCLSIQSNFFNEHAFLRLFFYVSSLKWFYLLFSNFFFVNLNNFCAFADNFSFIFVKKYISGWKYCLAN